jgi:hypothetical protein
MRTYRLTIVVIAIGLISLGGAALVYADKVNCGYIYSDTYRPYVSDCGDWLIQRFPTRPTLKNGRWVINDDGLEFTLVYNSGTVEWGSKDEVMLYARDHNVQVRFGQAQPLDGTEPDQEYLNNHIGLYIESEYAGEWMPGGKPQGH